MKNRQDALSERLAIGAVLVLFPLFAWGQMIQVERFETYLLNPTSIGKDCAPPNIGQEGRHVIGSIYKCVEDSALRGLLVRLAEQGNAKAVEILAAYYLLNDGDHAQTVYWLRKQIALLPDNGPRFQLASQLVIRGTDQAEVSEGLNLAAGLSDHGDLDAKSLLAEYYIDRNDLPRALSYQRELAATGEAFRIRLLVHTLLQLAATDTSQALQACAWSRIGADRAKVGSWYVNAFQETRLRAEKLLAGGRKGVCIKLARKISKEIAPVVAKH